MRMVTFIVEWYCQCVLAVAGVYPYTDKLGDVDIPPTLYVVRRQCWRAGRQFVGFVSWPPFGGVVSAVSLWRLSRRDYRFTGSQVHRFTGSQVYRFTGYRSDGNH